MTRTSTILELRNRTNAGIFAVIYRRGRPRGVIRLLDGTIVETTTSANRRDIPANPDECLLLAIDGGVATIHHIQLGLVDAFLAFEGIFLLPDGRVAAIYGAEVVPIS